MSSEDEDLKQAEADLGMCLCQVKAGDGSPAPCAKCQADEK